MRDSNPMTGQVWLVDENNHMVATFKIMRPECHIAGANHENVDASRNLTMADALIEHLEFMWAQQPNAPVSDGASVD